MGLTKAEELRLHNLRAIFEHSGGRGVEVAEEIDFWEAKRDRLSLEEFKAILNDVTCPPYEYRLGCVLCVREGQEEIQEDQHPDVDHVLFLQAKLYRNDIRDGEDGWGYGGKYLLSPHMTTGEVVKKCFVACRDFAEHEVREAFEWKGRRILGPHLSVDSLWDVAQNFEERP